MIHSTTLSAREIIQRAFGALGASFSELPLNDKVHEVSMIVDIMGHGDRVTTGQVRQQIIRTGRA